MEKVRLQKRNRLHFANFIVKMSKNKRTNQIKLSSYNYFAKQINKISYPKSNYSIAKSRIYNIQKFSLFEIANL